MLLWYALLLFTSWNNAKGFVRAEWNDCWHLYVEASDFIYVLWYIQWKIEHSGRCVWCITYNVYMKMLKLEACVLWNLVYHVSEMFEWIFMSYSPTHIRTQSRFLFARLLLFEVFHFLFRMWEIQFWGVFNIPCKCMH